MDFEFYSKGKVAVLMLCFVFVTLIRNSRRRRENSYFLRIEYLNISAISIHWKSFQILGIGSKTSKCALSFRFCFDFSRWFRHYLDPLFWDHLSETLVISKTIYRDTRVYEWRHLGFFSLEVLLSFHLCFLEVGFIAVWFSGKWRIH